MPLPTNSTRVTELLRIDAQLVVEVRAESCGFFALLADLLVAALDHIRRDRRGRARGRARTNAAGPAEGVAEALAEPFVAARIEHGEHALAGAAAAWVLSSTLSTASIAVLRFGFEARAPLFHALELDIESRTSQRPPHPAKLRGTVPCASEERRKAVHRGAHRRDANAHIVQRFDASPRRVPGSFARSAANCFRITA